MPVLARFIALFVLPALVILGLGYSTIFGGTGWLHRQRVDAELVAADHHRDEVDAEVAGLQHEVDQLRNDRTTLERAAAEDLLLVPKSSTVYRFDNPAASSGALDR